MSVFYKTFNLIAKTPARQTGLLILLDFFNLIYLKSRYLEKFLSPAYLRFLFNQLGPQVTLQGDLLKEIKAVMASTFSLVLCLIFVFNTIMYFLYYKKKKWGIEFVKGYALFAVVLTIIELFTFFQNFSWWFLYLIVSIYFYFHFYKLVKQHEKN